MSKKPTKPQSPKQAREARIKAALRANLQRRKGQARARVTPIDNTTSNKTEQSES